MPGVPRAMTAAARAVMEPSAAAQTGRVLAPMLVYVLMAAILAARPQGLFGARP